MQNTKYKKIILGLQIFGVVLMGFYTFQINKSSTKGYELRQLQKERLVLLSKKEELNLKIARAQNFYNLKNNFNVQNMISYQDGNISYFDKKSDLAMK
ncbi:hypothetical protein LR002_00075 [Candidatus Gracilibacteria bacterium]|nr:hypothetical protein [Candidatus Gracilibacteria bacterium]